jgi:hypothetical protein
MRRTLSVKDIISVKTHSGVKIAVLIVDDCYKAVFIFSVSPNRF